MNLDNILTAADSTNMEAGGDGIFASIGKSVAFGAPSAVVSGLVSIANTGIYYKNKLFNTDTEEIDVAEVLDKGSATLGDYYKEHKEALDTVGFIAGSFIPGGLAVKGVNLWRMGKTPGAFARVAGFTATRQQAALKAGLQELADQGPSVYQALAQTRRASMAWGVADNVLQAGVFEVATALTMHQSPTLKDEQWGDVVWDMAVNSLAGGAIGGGIEALFVKKIFRDATKAVDAKMRVVDNITEYTKRGLGFGDETFAVMKAITDLPQEVLDAKVPFSYRLNGKQEVLDLDVTKLLGRRLDETVKKGLDRVQGAISYVNPADTSVGAPFANALVDIVRQGRAEGVSADVINQKLGEHLWGLKGIQGIGRENIDFTKEVFYFTPGVHISSDADVVKSVTTARPSKDAQAYRLVGSWADLRKGMLGIDDAPGDAKEAFAAGFDMVINPRTRRFEINPNSELIKKINPKSEDNLVRMVFHPRTQTTSDSAVPMIADVATNENKLNVTGSGVQAGQYTFAFKTNTFNTPQDTVEATARHLWADTVKSLKNQTVNSKDFSLLDKMLENPEIWDDTTKIRMPDGTFLSPTDEKYFQGWVLDRKLEEAVKLWDPKAKQFPMDHRELAYRLNVEPQFVEKMIAANFDPKPLAGEMKDAFRPLKSYGARDNLVLSYDREALENSSQFVDGMLNWQSRVREANNRLIDTFHAVMPQDAVRAYPAFDASVKGADVTGTGPSAFGASNADYTDPLRAKFQAIGQWVSEQSQAIVNEKLTAIQPLAARIISNKNIELGAVLSKARQVDEPLYLDGNRIVDYAWMLAERKRVEQMMKTGKEIKPTQPKINIALNDDTAGFLKTYHEQHGEWFNKKSLLANAQGTPWPHPAEALYLPPIDTKNIPYFAFVRDAEGKMFSTGHVSMITARTAEDLQALTNKIKQDHPTLEVLTKSDSERYFKAKGDYDFQSGLNDPAIDSYLKKSGKLGDFMPVMEPKAVVEEFVRFIKNREESLIRASVSAREAETFSQLRWLSNEYTELQKSKFAFIGKLTGKTLTDPFGDYIRLALNVSKKNEYTFWHEANAFVDALGTRAYAIGERAFNEARSGKVTWEQANAELEKVGLPQVFKDQEGYLLAQVGASERNIIKTAVAKGNNLLATVGLRLDTANSIVNVISMPLMMSTELSAIRNSLKKDPNLLAAFNEKLSVATPDGALQVPTSMKGILEATKSYFGPQKDELIARYKAIGAIKDVNSQFHQMLSDLALTPNMAPKEWAKKVDNWTEKAATFTGNNKAEEFTRFVAADVMRQVTDPVVAAGKMSLPEQDTFIRIFVNRVQGNYVASQRPIAFQGTIGAAISLFQTYQFNLYQQLFRHIENRDLKTIALMGGIQSSLFGLNGLPLFDAINTHLIGTANINEQHNDAYSTIVKLTDKRVADWALYGTASAFPFFSEKMPALYTRGDLNPRHMTLIPTSFQDVPIVSVATRAAGAVAGFASTVSAGGELVPSFMSALEHQGLSRPLAGLAQVLKGESTTSKGSLIAANQDMISLASAARVIGARPMDESVALNTRFRMNAYRAFDLDRIEKLGVAVKQAIREGNLDEDTILGFASEYASRGGRIDSYNAAMQRWMRGATQSDVNRLMRAHGSVYGRRLLEVMGADPLPDYANPEE